MTGERILVLKQEGLRQFVEAEPGFAAIRAAHPGTPIDLLTTPAFGRLAKGAPYFDRVLAAGPFAGKPAQKEFISQLKKIGYHTVYDLDGTRGTLDIKAGLAGFRGPNWVGPKRVMTKPGRGGAAFTGAAVRKLLSDAHLSVEQRLPDLEWALSGRKDAANMQPSWFGISGPFALLVPASDPARRWPASHYAAMAQALADEGVVSVMIGAEDIGEFAQAVAKLASGEGRNAAAGMVVDLTGKADLAQVAMLARHAVFFVAGASEELHLCVSVGCPGVVLLHPGESGEADSLYGRDVIKLTAPDMANLAPDMALNMLRNMGLLTAAAGDNVRFSA